MNHLATRFRSLFGSLQHARKVIVCDARRDVASAVISRSQTPIYGESPRWNRYRQSVHVTPGLCSASTFARAAMVAASAVMFMDVACAVDANTSPVGVLQEILVTATKRSENIQNVPLSITALSDQVIEHAGISTFEDYAAKVPNLTFASGLGIIDGRQVAIRGVQGADTTGFYIDDLPIPATMDPRVVDLDRIEVLRGPQGTLYGSRSMGGTVRLITHAPDLDSMTARVHVLGSQVDSGGNGYQTDATVNLPLVDHQAAIRLTGFVGTDGAFISREFPNPAHPSELTSVKVARNDFSGGMASLLWKPSDNFTVRPILMTQSSGLNGFPLADNSSNTMSQVRPLDVPEPAYDRWTYGGMSLTYSTPIGDIVSASSWFSRRVYESEDLSQYVAYAFGTPLLPGSIDTWKYGHSFVEELRFSSRFNGPLQFTGGLYLQRAKNNYDQNSTVPGLNASSGGTLGTDLVYAVYGPGSTKEDAVFGEFTYQITQRWSLTAGARYSIVDISQFLFNSGLAGAGSTNPGGEEIDHDTSPKFVIKYEQNADLSYYALASKGFRPGDGQGPPPESFCGADYAASGLTPADLSHYKADYLWNYEIGAKSTLFDRSVTLNGALFWIDWKDIQQYQRFSCGYDFTVNAGAAESRGGEVELSAVPFRGLTVTTGIGYTDAKITATTPQLQTPVGAPIQQIAPWTISASADYSFPLDNALKGFVRVDTNYTDHSFSANNDPVNMRLRPSYDITNFRVGVRADSWSFTAFADNISNTHANLGDNQSQGAELPGRPRILVNRPRTIGLEMTKRW